MSTREAAFTLLPVVLFESWPALARFAQAHRGAPVAEWSVAARSRASINARRWIFGPRPPKHRAKITYT